MVDKKNTQTLNTDIDTYWSSKMVLFSALFNTVGRTVINTADAIITCSPSTEHVSSIFTSGFKATCGGLFLTGLAVTLKYAQGDKTELDLKKQYSLILIAGALTSLPERDLSKVMLELGSSIIGLLSIIALCTFIPETDEKDQTVTLNSSPYAPSR